MKRVYAGYKAEKFLKNYVPVSNNELVKKFDEITIEAPLVLKLISPQALHKTDIGGVKIVMRQDEVEDAFYDLMALAHEKKIKLEGILVQEFYNGEQFIIGIKRDPVFNHVLLCGLGGIFTELLNDISIRKCPIDDVDAQEMVDELKSRKLFYGFRGKKLNLEAFKKILVSVSHIPKKHPSISELDINPIIVNGHEGRVVDARIVFS